MSASYCHISAQASRYAGELGKLDAYDEARVREIRRIVDEYPDARAMAEQIIGSVGELAAIAEADDIAATVRLQRMIEREYYRDAEKRVKL